MINLDYFFNYLAFNMTGGHLLKVRHKRFIRVRAQL